MISQTRIRLVLSLLAGGVLLTGSLVAGAGSATLGYVHAVTGTAWLNETRVVPHTTLQAGDVLKTQPGARVVIALPGHGYAAVEELTETALDTSPEAVEVRLRTGRVVVQQGAGSRLQVLVGGSEVQLLSPGSRPAVCAVSAKGRAVAVECSQGEARILAAARGEALVVPAGYRAFRGAWRAQGGSGGGQRAGQVSAVIPQANIERGAQAAPAAQNSEVLWNDLLKTERSGRARLGLDDGSLLNVGSDSELRVVKHDAATRQSELVMAYGRMRIQVRKLPPGGKFEVRTSTAVLGVIGSDVFIEATRTWTRVIVFKGAVQVSSILAGVAGQTTVGPGQQSLINAGQPPSAPSPAQMNLQTAMNQTDAGAGPGAGAGIGTAWSLVPIVGAVVLPPIIVATVDDEPRVVSRSQP